MTAAELVVMWRALVDKTRAEPWFDGRAERIACFDTAAEQLEAALRASPEPTEAEVERALDAWLDPDWRQSIMADGYRRDMRRALRAARQP